MINRRFLFFKREEDFLAKKDEILNDSIVFVEDERYIWTHGKKYVCKEEGFPEVIDAWEFGDTFPVILTENREDLLQFTLLIQNALNSKVDKQNGKLLSTNDFTDELLNKLNSLGESSVDIYLDINSENPVQNKVVTAALNSKVDNTTLNNYYNRDLAQLVFQLKLLEGSGISIQNNVISSTLNTYDPSEIIDLKFITISTTRYLELVLLGLINENIYYFTYEGEEDLTNESSEWTFPITLTDGSTPDSIGTFPINLV